MIKFGTSMLSWIPCWTREGGAYAIKKAAQCGFDLLEISLPPHLDIDVDRTKRELARNKIAPRFTLLLPKEYHVPLYPKKALNYIKRSLDLVSEMEGRLLGGVFYASIGAFTGDVCKEEEKRVIRDVLAEGTSYAASKRITLLLEPVNRYETYVMTSTKEAMAFISAVGSPNLRLMLDTFHMNIEESGFYKPIIAAGKQLHYMHISASDRGMPGKGNICWDELFRGLADIEFDGDLVIENFSSEVEGMAGLTSLWRKSGYAPDELAIKSLQFTKSKASKWRLC